MLKQEEWEKLNEMIASIYGIKNRKAMRSAFLVRLMSLVDFDLADFHLAQEDANQDRWLKDPVVVSIFDRSVEQEFIKAYEKRYYKMDYANWIFSHYTSVVYRESDLLRDKVRHESRFYKEYLSRYDLGNAAGISIISDGKLAGAVTLYKSEDKGNFSDRDLYILNMLLPHLQNVLSSRNEHEENDKQQVQHLLKYQYGITKKEMEIMALILRGYTNEEISRKNKISMNTVKSHIANIFDKIGVKSRTQLIHFLIQNRFLAIEGG